MENNLKYITVAPHVKGKADVSKINLYIILSLLPAVAFSIYKYGLNAVIHLAVTTGVCVSIDYLYNFFVNKKSRAMDFSSIYTGIIITLLLPAYAPFYIGVVGGVIGILFVKHLLGGLVNFNLNPVVSAKCLLILIFYKSMRMYTEGVMDIPVERLLRGKGVNTFNLMVGNVDGSMGEVCAIALLIGAVILVVTGVVDIYIPASYILSFMIMVTILGGRGLDMSYVVSQLASGGFLLVVWYLATDYKNSPITPKGQLIYGLLLGVLTSLVRVFGRSTDDIYFVILIVNFFVPVIERFTIPKPFLNTTKKA